MKRLLVYLSLMTLATSALAQQPSAQLIPFQGRLTDQQGRGYTNGQYTIVFNLYSQAVAGTPSWTERHQSVGVINGMINVFLGSITPLTNQDFSITKYLGITIDADNNANTTDPEMVPRQMIIPAFWAKNSEKLAGQDWTPVFGVNSPLGSLPASKIQALGIGNDRIATNAITTDKIAPGAIQNSDIGDGQITVEKLSSSFALDTVIPPGTIQAYGGPNIPAGWLPCDGRITNRTDLPRLYQAIGTYWGNVGGGTNTFNLPDLRGLFLRGLEPRPAGLGLDPEVHLRTALNSGGNTGPNVGSYQADGFKAHQHYDNRANVGLSGSSEAVAKLVNLQAGDANAHLNSGDSLPAGSGETRPKNVFVNYIIKY